MVDIKQYVPEFLRTVEDLKQIWDSENVTLSAIPDEIDAMTRSRFILTADEAAIAELEEFLGLTPVELELSQRRERLMKLYGAREALTYARLEEALENVCDSYEAFIDEREQQLIVVCDDDAHEAVLRAIRAIVPVNMEIVLNTYPPQPLRGFWGASFYGYDFFLQGGSGGWL